MDAIKDLTLEEKELEIRRERSLAFFRGLMKNKHDGQKEMQEEAQTPEYREVIRRLKEKNAGRNA